MLYMQIFIQNIDLRPFPGLERVQEEGRAAEIRLPAV